MRCVNASFENNQISFKAQNSIMQTNAKQWTEYGTLYWPSITINKSTYRGDITPANILEAICASLWSKPKVCLDFYSEENIQIPMTDHSSIVTGELLILIVATLLAVNIGLIFAYRRCAKREMEQDIGFQVSSAVSQYIALSQSTTKTNPSNTSIEQ